MKPGKPSFRDHAANERTFLAWVRTGIAVMAFGFLVEKFSLFTEYLRGKTDSLTEIHHGSSAVGFGLVLFGTLIIALSTWRFVVLRREIDKMEAGLPHSDLPDILLGLLLTLVGLFLAFYLGRQLFVK